MRKALGLFFFVVLMKKNGRFINHDLYTCTFCDKIMWKGRFAMSITIKDIAKLAGVSHATVSRALNDSPLISDKTKERIKKIAKDHHYTPNYSARSLKLDKSYNIGVFLSAFEGTSASFFFSSIKGVNRLMKERNYNLVVKAIDDLDGNYTMVNSKHYDGILVVSQKKKRMMHLLIISVH